MAAEVKFTNLFKQETLKGSVDWDNDTIKAMLLTASHTTNVDTQEYADDISANEVATSGSYTQGHGNRMTVTATTSHDDTADEGVVDVSFPAITTYTGSPAFVAFIKEGTSDDTDALILAIEDLNGAKTATAGTWTYTDNSDGLINLA